MNQFITKKLSAIWLILFVFTVSGCASIDKYDKVAYQNATSLKVDSLSLMDKATAAYADNKASKLYIKNTDAAGASASTVAVSLGTIGGESKIGILHNNEWAWIPWSGASDINVECSSATTLVEWMLIFE